MELQLKPNIYKILSDCIERGINYGLMRAHKYDETPTEDTIKENVHRYIMLEICEDFKFPENE